MSKFLRVGYAHYIDEENCQFYGIKNLSVATALMGMSAKSLELGCTTSQGEWYDRVLYFTLYLHFDVTHFPSNWKANDFALSFNFGPCDPISDGDPVTKSFKIVDTLPEGCILGEIESPQPALVP